MPYDVYEDGDNWTDLKQNGAESSNFKVLGNVKTCHFSGSLGDGDKVDYAQFSFNAPAKLSFWIEADAGVTLSIYKLTGSPGKYSLKLLQSTTTKRYVERDEDGAIMDITYEVTSSPYLFTDTSDDPYSTYYMAVRATSSISDPYYTIEFNDEKSCFYEEAANGKEDDWTDLKQKGEESTEQKAVDVQSMYRNGNVIRDWVGLNDTFDYMLFTVDDVAKLSFSISSSAGSVQLSVCEVTGSPDKYSLKTLATATVLKAKKKRVYYDDEFGWEYEEDDEQPYKANTKSLLLGQGKYYIRVKSLNANTGGSANYTLSVNQDKSSYFDEAIGGKVDDWTDMTTKGGNSTELGTGLIQVQETGWDIGGELYQGWVGMNDPFDYVRLTVEDPTKLNLSLYATDATKITIYSLTGEAGNYSPKKLKTSILTKLKKTYEYSSYGTDYECSYKGSVKNLLLDRGVYYVRIESTNANTGGSSRYFIEAADSTFYDADYGWNNRLLDESNHLVKEAVAGDLLDQRAIAITNYTDGIQLDNKPVNYTQWITDEDSRDWNNFVGFGDGVDYLKISLDNRAKLSFDVSATGSSKFVIYQLIPMEGGAYKQKALQTTVLSKRTKTYYYTDWVEVYDKWDEDWYDVEVTRKRNYTYFGAKTKAIWLDGGEYYLSMQSLNAKSGGRAYYSVYLNTDACVDLPAYSGNLVVSRHADNGFNNYVFDEKSKLNPNLVPTQIDPFFPLEVGSFRLDRIPLDPDKPEFYWNNFVGYQDEADYAEFNLTQDLWLSFKIETTDSVRFSVWELNQTDKNGETKYALTALQQTIF